MTLVADLLRLVAEFALATIETLGYGGVFVLMIMESMIFPIPSEAVLPFAGFLAATGRMDFWIAFAAATVGTLVGSLLSYGMGWWGLRPLLDRYGRYVFVTRAHLDSAHVFFERRSGGVAIFLSRFVPVVRHLISIPAGSARMPLPTFMVATVLGGGAWNFILLYAGFVLGENWEAIEPALVSTRLVVATALGLALAVAVTVVVWNRRRVRKLGQG